ncbi:MAG: hypothetical protein EBT58_00710 [Betaproteobacteria bacterium]|nr:hypothetical protein [Betaproteobacteria bacterium]
MHGFYAGRTLLAQHALPSAPTDGIGCCGKLSSHRTIGQVKTVAKSIRFVSRAEQEGGGYIYESGWTKKSNWNWRQPFGVPGQDSEPAVHLTFDEAQSICRFFGKRLPTDQEWTQAYRVAATTLELHRRALSSAALVMCP